MPKKTSTKKKYVPSSKEKYMCAKHKTIAYAIHSSYSSLPLLLPNADIAQVAQGRRHPMVPHYSDQLKNRSTMSIYVHFGLYVYYEQIAHKYPTTNITLRS